MSFFPFASTDSRALLSNVAPSSVISSPTQIFEPHIEVEINHNGEMNNADAKGYGEQIADTAIEKLYSAFERRGINSTRGSRLKP